MNGDSSTTAATGVPTRAGRPAWRTMTRRALTLWRRNRVWRRPPWRTPRTDMHAERVEPRPARAGG
jgi:hypothetical protein